MIRSPTINTSLTFVGLALVCLFFADLEISTGDPWEEIGRTPSNSRLID